MIIPEIVIPDDLDAEILAGLEARGLREATSLAKGLGVDYLSLTPGERARVCLMVILKTGAMGQRRVAATRVAVESVPEVVLDFRKRPETDPGIRG